MKIKNSKDNFKNPRKYSGDGGDGNSENNPEKWTATRPRHRPAPPSRSESPGVVPGHKPLAKIKCTSRKFKLG